MSQPEKLQNKVVEVTDNLSARGLQLPYASKMKAGDQKQKSTIVAGIILNFTTRFPSPSIELIFKEFKIYGIYKPETRYLNNITAQVVFVRKDCAKVAYHKLKENNSFGPVLASYHLTHLSVAKTNNGMPTPFGMISQKSMNQLNGMQLAPPGFSQDATNQLNGVLAPSPGFSHHPMNQFSGLQLAPLGFPKHATNQYNGLLAPPPGFPHQPMNQFNGLPTFPVMIPHNGESRNFMFIKQELKEMSSVMEKEGSRLPLEMRSELEIGIKCLKPKVNSLIGSSS